jgi:hypothetical protein
MFEGTLVKLKETNDEYVVLKNNNDKELTVKEVDFTSLLSFTLPFDRFELSY